MRVRDGLAGLLIAGALIGCGGSTSTGGPGPTNAGPGATTTGPGMTTGPGASTGGGGGGGGGNTGGGTGQIHIAIGGPKQLVVDQPFFAIGSRFGGVAGTQLNFTSDGATGIASITVTADSATVVVSYVGEDIGGYNSQDCQLSNWNIGQTSGSGSFDCKNGFATTADGQYLTGVTMKGSFQAAQ